jgi:predicted negative regulator of RcsB-dependent stress response
MVEAINGEHINTLDSDRTQVSCVTCHRGVRKPQTTSMVLQTALDADGVAGVEASYRELRSRYYGTHSYDFSESVLADLAQKLSRGGDADGALKLLDLNESFFPDSFRNHWLKGEVSMHAGDRAAARSSFEKALAIGADPRSEAFIRQRLDSLND